MGMFDHVNVDIPCPECGGTVDWQSKDGPCGLMTLDPTEVGYFGCYCTTCQKTFTYSRDRHLARKEPRVIPFSVDDVTKMGFELC